MTDTSLVLARIAQTLDLLAFLAWLPAAAAATVVLRVTWLRLTALELRIDRGLIPVALPSDWPMGPVAPYGPRTRRAAYPAAMRRALFLATGLVVGALVLSIGVAALRPHEHASKFRPPVIIIGPEPGPISKPQALPSPPPGPEPPSLKDFFSALIQPSREAPPDSLDALFRASLEVPSSYAGTGPGWGTGPSEGPDDGSRGIGEDPTGVEPDPPTFVPVDELPILVSIPVPRYPELARQSALEGQVTLRLLVGRSGLVEKIIALESIPALDEAARNSAAQARFKPATFRGRPVRVWVTLPLRFALDDAH